MAAVRFQTLTYVTSSILAGASSSAGDTDQSIGPSLVNVDKVKVVPNTAGGTFDVRIYKDAAQANLLAYYPAVSPNLYDPMDVSSGSPAEALEGPPIPFEDIDTTGKFHLKITNNDSIAHTYTITVEYEEVPVMTAAGGATFRGATLHADGTAGAPSVSFISEPSSGLLRNTTNDVRMYIGGSFTSAWLSNRFSLATATQLDWNGDVILLRDTSNTLALKNGTNAQNFRIYGTTTGNHYLSFQNDGTNGYIQTIGGTDPLYLGINGQNDWLINSSHFFAPNVDNTLDFGASGSRIRSAYIGTSLIGMNAGINSSATQTTYNGSIAGTAIWSMPFQGTSYKKFIIYYVALHDAGGTITFPTAFTKTPTVYGDTAATGITTASTTTLTIAVTAATSGFAIVEGY